MTIWFLKKFKKRYSSNKQRFWSFNFFIQKKFITHHISLTDRPYINSKVTQEKKGPIWNDKKADLKRLACILKFILIKNEKILFFHVHIDIFINKYIYINIYLKYYYNIIFMVRKNFYLFCFILFDTLRTVKPPIFYFTF